MWNFSLSLIRKQGWSLSSLLQLSILLLSRNLCSSGLFLFRSQTSWQIFWIRKRQTPVCLLSNKNVHEELVLGKNVKLDRHDKSLWSSHLCWSGPRCSVSITSADLSTGVLQQAADGGINKAAVKLCVHAGNPSNPRLQHHMACKMGHIWTHLNVYVDVDLLERPACSVCCRKTRLILKNCRLWSYAQTKTSHKKAAHCTFKGYSTQSLKPNWKQKKAGNSFPDKKQKSIFDFGAKATFLHNLENVSKKPTTPGK